MRQRYRLRQGAPADFIEKNSDLAETSTSVASGEAKWPPPPVVSDVEACNSIASEWKVRQYLHRCCVGHKTGASTDSIPTFPVLHLLSTPENIQL